MSDPRLPWFPFYVSEWMLDSLVQAWPLATQGAYLKLLCLAWWNDGIPDDERAIIALIGPEGEVAWIPSLRDKWEPHPNRPGFLHNPKLLSIATLQRERANKLREAGARGAKARRKPPHQPGSSDPDPSKRERERESSLTTFVSPDRVENPDPKPKRKPVDNPTWVQEATAMFEQWIGILPHGRIGKALRPAVERYGWHNPEKPNDSVKRWWEVYCKQRPYQRSDGSFWGDRASDVGDLPPKNTTWCTPEDFVKNVAKWREDCLPPGKA